MLQGSQFYCSGPGGFHTCQSLKLLKTRRRGAVRDVFVGPEAPMDTDLESMKQERLQTYRAV